MARVSNKTTATTATAQDCHPPSTCSSRWVKSCALELRHELGHARVCIRSLQLLHPHVLNGVKLLQRLNQSPIKSNEIKNEPKQQQHQQTKQYSSDCTGKSWHIQFATASNLVQTPPDPFVFLATHIHASLRNLQQLLRRKQALCRILLLDHFLAVDLRETGELGELNELA